MDGHSSNGALDAGENEALSRAVQKLFTLTPDGLAAYREEIAAAPDDDPKFAFDREALARFDYVARYSAVPATP